jgi:phage terminase large subunit GpA-like protein
MGARHLKRDPISRDAVRTTIIDLRTRNFAPWAIMDPVTWATTVRRMPDEHGATKPFTFEFAPYEREPFVECFNPRNQEVVLQMFSRGGKSEIVLNVLGYIIHQRPCRNTHIHETFCVFLPSLSSPPGGKSWLIHEC